MIHIVTQHFGTDAWFQIQKEYIEKYTPDKNSYKVYLLVYKTEVPASFILPSNYEIIDLNKVDSVFNEHYSIVESCFDNFISQKVADDDIVVYLDSDAFPIDLWTIKVSKYLEDNHICAIYRYEDRGTEQPDKYYPYPHLCFFSFLKKYRQKYGFRHEIPRGFPCPGFTICDVIRENSLKVKELIRTNKFNNHPTMFGIYDDMIYHQSSGSRSLIGRPYVTGNGAKQDLRLMCYEGIDFYARKDVESRIHGFVEKDVNEINLLIWNVIYQKIKQDLDLNFLRRFYIGKF